MAQNSSTGETVSPLLYRPKPRPQMQSDDRAPPALPAKQSVYSERAVETRLGIISQSLTSPVIPPSPFPSPPELPQRRLPPEPPPRSDEDASVLKGGNAMQSDERVNAEERGQSGGTGANKIVNDSVSSFSVGRTSTEQSADESGSSDQAEPLQLRSKSYKSPELAKTSGTEGDKVSRFSTAARVSQYVLAAEKAAARPERPAPLQKPGRVVVPGGLEEKIASSLARQQTMRTVMLTDDQPDVGVDVAASEARKHSEKKPLRSQQHEYGLDVSEDTKSTLIGQVFWLIIFSATVLIYM